MIYIHHNNISNGPGKVAKNLILGLKMLDKDFYENPVNINNKKNHIFLQYSNLMKDDDLLMQSIIGPNICTLPIDNQLMMSKKYKKTLVPSEWVKKLYSKWIDEDKIEVWPVGIDTDYFSDKSNQEKRFDCLVYFKRRNPEDLLYVTNLLKKHNQTYNIISYGNYNESDFLSFISQSRYCIIVDNTESQGIAIQEIMSCNLPLFVWDVTMWVDRGSEHACKASTIPYWDERCGVFEVNKDNIENSFLTFLDKLGFFNPRGYILENLTLDKKARDLIIVFNK